MEEVRREERVSVRLEGEDSEALDWLVERVRGITGPGIRVERSDAVRWAIHACRALLERQEAEEGR